MNRYIKNGMLFFGIITQILVYAAEKTSVQPVDLAAVADAQLKEKVARYFSNRRSTVPKNDLNHNNLSEAKDMLAQGLSFHYTTKQPARAEKCHIRHD